MARYGFWGGAQTAIPLGMNIGTGFAQYINALDTMSVNKIKHQQYLKQLEEEEQLVPKQKLISDFGIGETDKNRRKIFDDAWTQIDPNNTGFAKRRDINNMDKFMKSPMNQHQLMQATVADAQASYEASQKAYDDYVTKKKEKGESIEKDEKAAQLKEAAERQAGVLGRVKAKSFGVEAEAKEWEATQRMLRREEERRETEYQKALIGLQKAREGYEEAMKRVKVKAAGEIEKKKTPSPNAGGKEGKPQWDTTTIVNIKTGQEQKFSYPKGSLATAPPGWRFKEEKKKDGANMFFLNPEAAPQSNYQQLPDGTLMFNRPKQD